MEGFEVLPVGPLRVNSTLLYSEGEAFLFDPGADLEKILSLLRERDLTLKGIFLTHGHIDHFGQVGPLKRLFPEVPSHLNDRDRFLLKEELWPGFANYLGAELNPPINNNLKEGDTFKVGNLEVEVYETPGHTPGSVVFYVPKLGILIAGDLLFKGSVGRWDLPGGNLGELKGSLKKVFSTFPPETVVITGHYDLTRLKEEEKNLKSLGLL